MLIATRQLRKRFSSSPVLSFPGKSLEPVASAKDLGVTLDSHLTYDWAGLWNNISPELRQCASLKAFKEKLKSHILANSY
ncbi:hypothetical protein pdam_00002865 [Pocillopora damicornis]|uniref:Uncharacterized protein n=1 Tax=Pocillopora damicornis TaxID=46731 RepID=A0A3M6U8L6_POCDA|nr:hypothetical protein pdam_00002865 [Pocillopora damicornis]